MTVIQAFLVGLVYWFGSCNIARAYFVFSKPLVCGFLVGLIFGDPLQGAMVGASINMIYLGWIGAGGSSPADPCAAGTLSTAFVLSAGLSTDAAMVLAVPIGLLAIFIYTLLSSLLSVCVHASSALIQKGKSDQLWLTSLLLPLCMSFVGYGIPCMICAYFGSSLVEQLTGVLLGTVLTVISVIGGMLPAVGIAINLSFIFKGQARIYLLVGFICAAYLGLDLIAIALIGFVAAVVYYYTTSRKEATA